MSCFEYGYWEVSIEKSGRLKLPAFLLKSLPEDDRKQFWITHGFGNHIMLWTNNAYKEQMIFLNSLDRNNRDIKKYRNAFLRNTTFVESDSQDRIVVPRSMMDYYNIEKEIVLLLDNGRIEIWNYNYYQEEFGIAPNSMEKLNESIHNGLFNQNSFEGNE